MRYLFGLALLLMVPASAARVGTDPDFVEATEIALDRDHPERREFGALQLVSSWTLVSSNLRFGGISSMRIDDGNRILAISDRGSILEFTVAPGEAHWPLGERPVPAGPGPKVGFGIFDRDIESMAYDPASGRTWLAFEYWNTIWRYNPALSAPVGKRARPDEMRKWPLNQGPEAMVRLRDGRFLLFSENVRPEKNGADAARGLIFARDPLIKGTTALRFQYQPPAGYRPTDAAQLPDGRVLVLNRHFSLLDGVAAAITIFDLREIRRRRTLVPRLVARFTPPLNIDNMEALAVTQEGDRTFVWIASDDNFSLLQQTLLMKFTLDPTRIK